MIWPSAISDIYSLRKPLDPQRPKKLGYSPEGIPTPDQQEQDDSIAQIMTNRIMNGVKPDESTNSPYLKNELNNLDTNTSNEVPLSTIHFPGHPDVSHIQIPSYLPNAPDKESIYDRLERLLTNPPLESNYKPSTKRKVAGAIIGGLSGAAFGPKAGREEAESITKEPYRQKYQDWLTQATATEKAVGLDINRARAESSGLGDYASYLRAVNEGNPELQGRIAGSKTAAEEQAKNPARQTEAEQKLYHDTLLSGLTTLRDRELEQMRQSGQDTRDKANIASREKIAQDEINSRENIARLNRELRKQIAGQSKTSRVPPNQQFLAQMMAEDEVSKSIADAKEYKALFDETTNTSTGVKTIRLKKESDVDPNWKAQYKLRKQAINELAYKIIRNSSKPGAAEPEFDINNDNDNEFDIEAVGGK